MIELKIFKDGEFKQTINAEFISLLAFTEEGEKSLFQSMNIGNASMKNGFDIVNSFPDHIAHVIDAFCESDKLAKAIFREAFDLAWRNVTDEK